jgi:hypothetical protein
MGGTVERIIGGEKWSAIAQSLVYNGMDIAKELFVVLLLSVAIATRGE